MSRQDRNVPRHDAVELRRVGETRSSPDQRRNVDDILDAWRSSVRVRVLTWVHPECCKELRSESGQAAFARSIRHALCQDLNEAVCLLHNGADSDALVRAAPWSRFLASLHVELQPLEPDVVKRLLSPPSATSFYVNPRRLRATSLRPTVTTDSGEETLFTYGVAPARVLALETSATDNLSWTDRALGCAILNEDRFLLRDPPACSYEGLLVDARAADADVIRAGLYQRYLISHEFGHLMGLGHPVEGWAARARPHHICMDQQTRNVSEDGCCPVPLPSLLDLQFQSDRDLRFIRALVSDTLRTRHVGSVSDVALGVVDDGELRAHHSGGEGSRNGVDALAGGIFKRRAQLRHASRATTDAPCSAGSSCCC